MGWGICELVGDLTIYLHDKNWPVLPVRLFLSSHSSLVGLSSLEKEWWRPGAFNGNLLLLHRVLCISPFPMFHLKKSDPFKFHPTCNFKTKLFTDTGGFKETVCRNHKIISPYSSVKLCKVVLLFLLYVLGGFRKPISQGFLSPPPLFFCLC